MDVNVFNNGDDIDASPFATGQHVVLSHPDFQGRRGILGAFDQDTRLWDVSVTVADGGGAHAAPANISIGSQYFEHVRIQHILPPEYVPTFARDLVCASFLM